MAEALGDGTYRSAQEIHGTLVARGHSISLATVYRNLQQLVAAGAVDVLLRDDGEAAFVRGTTDHHHHLVCRACGKVAEIADVMVAQWSEQVAAAHGFVEVSHQLVVFGRCPDCTGSRSALGPRPGGP